MLVRSLKTPIGRVRRRTSRNRRSMLFVVRVIFRHSGSSNWKKFINSTKSFRRHSTAFG